MAIGDQIVDGATVTAASLRQKYSDLIREAILKARPTLDVARADDVSLPGTMTTDIVTRIMHSDYVVADVTYPNPNVFYELGMRHACRVGTIIIKDRAGPRVPFDIAHLRYVEYENTTTGLKELAQNLSSIFEHFERDPARPDNHFQEVAKLTNYLFPDYKKADEDPPELQAMIGLFESPELLDLFMRQQSGEELDQSVLMQTLMKNPKVAHPFLQAMVKSGDLSFKSSSPPTRKGRRK